MSGRFPQVVPERGFRKLSRSDCLLFDLPGHAYRLGDPIECKYTDRFSLTISDCEPEEAAAILDWFLPHLPAGTPSVALVDSHAVPVALPPLAGIDAIAAFLRTLSQCDGTHL